MRQALAQLCYRVARWLAPPVPEVGAQYEQVKVEIARPHTLTRAGVVRVHGGEDSGTVMREETKRALFVAVVEGFARSAEIEKFIYYREHETIKTVGIRLYLRHDK